MTKLEEMLLYVSEHNDFYKKRIAEYGITNPLDITQYPVLTRKELQENRYNMFSDGYKSKYYGGDLKRQFTTGSTGVPINIYRDANEYYASNLPLWRLRMKWYGIAPNDRYVTFSMNSYRIKNDGMTVYYVNTPQNTLSVNVSLIQSDIGYEKLVDIIAEFEPRWLFIQPFVLAALLRAYDRTGKKPPKSLKYIESVGELLPRDLRRRAILFFNVPLADMYGSEEMNGIAYECPNHHMHVLNDNVFVEIKNGDNFARRGKGETIITNLKSHAMPLIRYNQGDIVRLGTHADSECPLYGESETIIEMMSGRSAESLGAIAPELSQFLLTEIISEANNILEDCIVSFRYRLVKSQSAVECCIVTDRKSRISFDKISAVIKRIYGEKCVSQNYKMVVIAENEVSYRHTKNGKIEIVE